MFDAFSVPTFLDGTLSTNKQGINTESIVAKITGGVLFSTITSIFFCVRRRIQKRKQINAVTVKIFVYLSIILWHAFIEHNPYAIFHVRSTSCSIYWSGFSDHLWNEIKTRLYVTVLKFSVICMFMYMTLDNFYRIHHFIY